MKRSQYEHPVFARLYSRLSVQMEPELGPRREQLLDGLAGTVLEIGAGNGLNFAHYPATVTRVVAIEPEPRLRALAEAGAARAPVPVEVLDAHVGALPIELGPFDAVVCSLVLCSVPDVGAALAGIHDVLRPGGELRVMEHVRASTPALSRVQAVFDKTFWPRVAGGCHAHRDVLAHLEQSALTVDRFERFRFPDTRFAMPTSPHLMAVARHP